MLTQEDIRALAEYFLAEDMPAAVETLSLMDEMAKNAVKLLEYVFEETPLKKCVADAVKAGNLSPDVFKTLFGTGEGAGLEEADGMTIERVLDSWYALDDKVNVMIDRKLDEH